jgi:hypothetical protein
MVEGIVQLETVGVAIVLVLRCSIGSVPVIILPIIGAENISLN